MPNSDNTYGTFNKMTKVIQQMDHKFVSAKTSSIKLNGAHNNSVTTIAVNDASSMPTAGTIEIQTTDESTYEAISYTGKDGNNLTGCTRGANSTSAASHSNEAWVDYIHDEVVSQSFGGDLTTAKDFFLTSNAQACINDNGTQVQYAITSDGNGLKWTVAFGVPSSTTGSDAWAEKYKARKTTLLDGNDWYPSARQTQEEDTRAGKWIQISDDSDHLF
tara:strand:+ start:129 stop:782 length:654 start_codon:yes stop_codon:yes gene_type:complete